MYQMEPLAGSITVGRVYMERLGIKMRVFLYYVDGLLIDTGPRLLADAFKAFVGSLSPVEQVVLTHFHEDHSGMAAYMARQYETTRQHGTTQPYPTAPQGEGRGVPVLCHPDFTDINQDTLRLRLYRRAFSGQPEPFPAQPLHGELETENFSFQVIPTPGHADEHVALYEPNRGWLFSGDLFLSTRVVTLMVHESPRLLMESLERVLALDVEEVFCSHVGLVEGGKAALQAKLQSLREIKGQVGILAAKGWRPGQVARHLFPGYWYKPLTVISGGEYSSAHIVRAFWPY